MSSLEDLVDAIANSFAQCSGPPRVEALGTPGGAVGEAEPRPSSLPYEEQVKELLQECYWGGFPSSLDVSDISATPLCGGMAAERVFEISSKITCVAKIDRSEKLAAEARKLMAIRSAGNLPQRLLKCFPEVYAAKLEGPPFAYIMEYFPTPPFDRMSRLVAEADQTRTAELLDSLVSLLLDIHGSTVDETLRPNLETIYMDRIRQRIAEAGLQQPMFAETLTQESRINGVAYAPLTSAFDAIEGRLERLCPPFVTFVHGDPHPRNVFLRKGGGDEIRLIDVKGWHSGDYIWDLGKLIHYVLVTGPVEDGDRSGIEATLTRGGSRIEIEYELDVPARTTSAVEHITPKVGEFARAWKDPYWEERLSLSIASNLLGLPAERLKRGDTKAAIIELGEGLKHFHEFVAATAKKLH